MFWATGRLERALKPKLVGLLLLGGLQGAVGWWMVASGLVDRTDVSQYRLATHLLLACLIFTATMVVARGLAPHSAAPADRATQRFAGLLLVLVLLQIYLGGLVAGLDGGLSYNTWPLMDGTRRAGRPVRHRSRPGAICSRTRRPCSSCTAAAPICCSSLALWHMIATSLRLPGTTHARRALVLFLLVLVQAAIGIGTLVMQVPLHLALTHQAFALIVLGFAAAHWRGTKGSYPLPTRDRGQALTRRDLACGYFLWFPAKAAVNPRPMNSTPVT